jgi:Cytochrome P450
MIRACRRNHLRLILPEVASGLTNTCCPEVGAASLAHESTVDDNGRLCVPQEAGEDFPWHLPSPGGASSSLFRSRIFCQAVGEPGRQCYLPFGTGLRVCIGQHSASMEARLVLASLNRHVKFDLQQERTAGLKTLHTDGPVSVSVHRRHQGVAQAPGKQEGVGLVDSIAENP